MRGTGIGLGLGVLALCAGPAHAQLALRRVMLSQAGVGYFEYAAEVPGATRLDLPLPRDQVSDALLSLVVMDPAGAARVMLPSEEGADAALADLPVPRAALGQVVDLLNALQGVVVSVSGPDPMTGRILHAEPPPELGGSAPVAVRDPRLGRTRVTLLTDAGLRQFVLEDAIAVQVADPALRAKLDAALAALRGTAGTERRTLSIALEGGGARQVRVGLVVAAPLWKMTYRLLVPEHASVPQHPGEPARLQAWALLENDGLADWHGVALALQAGNLVSFRQDVYRTVQVDRPEVPMDMREHVLPHMDTGAIPMAAAAPAPFGFARAMRAEPAAASEPEADTVFTLGQTLDLPAGHSALVPVLDRAVTARRVGLLAAAAAHPVESVALTNDTGAALPPGVVTTYDAQGFTGDARLGTLPRGQTRLLGFAVDEATSAQWHTGAAGSIAAIAASGGVLKITRRQRTTTTIDLRAPATEARDLLVELPREGGATLATEPPLSGITQTQTAWRLPVVLQAGQVLHLVAHADRLVSQSLVVAENVGPVVGLLTDQGLPPAARAALQHVVDLRREVFDAEAARQRLDEQRAAIDQDEQRVRDNLAAVPAGDALHARLIQALGADEDRLADLRRQRAGADDAVQSAHAALDAAIAALSF
jgi:hypothetical protein